MPYLEQQQEIDRKQQQLPKDERNNNKYLRRATGAGQPGSRTKRACLSPLCLCLIRNDIRQKPWAREMGRHDQKLVCPGRRGSCPAIKMDTSRSGNFCPSKQRPGTGICPGAGCRWTIIKDIQADGELHRMLVEGRPHGRDGAYKLHLDGLKPAGFIQKFVTGHPRTRQTILHPASSLTAGKSITSPPDIFNSLIPLNNTETSRFNPARNTLCAGLPCFFPLTGRRLSPASPAWQDSTKPVASTDINPSICAGAPICVSSRLNPLLFRRSFNACLVPLLPAICAPCSGCSKKSLPDADTPAIHCQLADKQRGDNAGGAVNSCFVPGKVLL